MSFPIAQPTAPTAEDVEHDRHLQHAGPGWHACYVRNPQLIRRGKTPVRYSLTTAAAGRGGSRRRALPLSGASTSIFVYLLSAMPIGPEKPTIAFVSFLLFGYFQKPTVVP
jgi:hypothetical protein